MMAMNAGDQIGSWVVESSLGEGGMGCVLRCHHLLDPSQRTAVKLLHDTEAANRQRMIQEFKLLRQLSHPCVLKVLEAGVREQQIYIVTELLEGETLKDRLSRGAMSETEVTALFGRLADGVAAAHAQEIWHRDLKPANIFLTADEPKILDFGIAMRQGATRLTRAGFYMGTPTYMAPESFQGETGAKADVYALGQMMWEALMGRRAFSLDQGDKALIKAKVLCDCLDPGEPFAPVLRRAIAAATDVEPERRPEVKDWLAEVEMFRKTSHNANLPPSALSTVLLLTCPRCGNMLRPGSICAACETNAVPVRTLLQQAPPDSRSKTVQLARVRWALSVLVATLGLTGLAAIGAMMLAAAGILFLWG